ncbi:major facilitator transporter [Actinoplanes sp. SE50]|uniref:MFS transporter n=1 Tax=unclassified Actinoplanes TaxID=2626549 RepID=UPI00023EC668|nr:MULTISPECIES: MFS transporter [unclassified Actinoplanes]AEV85882.1 major facilitator transporter [Actinoplanes sp. SE50/110]ATO84278.1 major facilitator transporter [Actinoplanes sp. SE50]SLM01688.1 MFS transporter [Actinoplanes sp. SE50/110]
MSVALVAGFMTLLDVSIVNVALPSIRAEEHLGSGELQWVLSGYALTFGLLLVPAGRYGDARGRRTAFIAGLAVFTLASAAAGLATGALWLIVARLVQGAAAGVVNPQVSGLIQQLFEPHERGKPFGLLGATIGISTAVGPLLGGLLIQLFGAEQGWRWIFYINVPIGLLAIVLGARWIPARPPEQREHESLDPVGVLLLGAGVFLLLLPLVQEREWTGNAKWLLVVAATAVLAGFWVWERRFARRSTPVVDLGLFRTRSYALGALVGILYFGGFTSIFFTYTLFLQNGLHYSALQAGLAITPFALGSAATAALGGRAVDRTGRTLVVAGLAVVAAGLAGTVLVLHVVDGTAAGWASVVPLLVAGLGSGLVISPNQTLTLSEVPVRRAGSAAAVLQTGQRIGAAIGIAGVGSVFFNRLAGHNGDWGLAFRTSLTVTIAFILAALLAAGADVLAGRRREHTMTLR